MGLVTMLTSTLEMDRAFDNTLKRAIPYLIFAPHDYRDRLVELMNGFCQFYREKNQIAFPERNNTINTLLDLFETSGFDQSTDLNIYYLTGSQQSILELFQSMNQRLRKLETEVNTLKIKMKEKKTPKEEVIEDVSEIVDPKKMTPEQKTDALINLLKSSEKPINSLFISKKICLTSVDIQNRIPRLEKKNLVKHITRMGQVPILRDRVVKYQNRKLLYYIWKDNIPPEGIPEPDEDRIIEEES